MENGKQLHAKFNPQAPSDVNILNRSTAFQRIWGRCPTWSSLTKFNHVFVFLFFVFFSIRVFFHGHRQIKREGTVFYSTLPLPSSDEHSDIYLQLCTWDDYRIFLIATLVFTRRDLPPYRITIWLIDDVMLIFVCLLVDLISGFITAIWH